MRRDRKSEQLYQDFWDWLRDDSRCFWLLSLIFAYVAYLGTTDPI
jgi:hypothetical protein